MSPQWIATCVTVLVAICGLGVNIYVIGRFVGQWSEALKNIGLALARVEERLEDTEDGLGETEGKRSLMDARLSNVEISVNRFYEMRDEFIAMRTAVELTSKSNSERLDGMGRSVSVIERQLGNLVSTKASGFTVLTSEEKS